MGDNAANERAMTIVIIGMIIVIDRVVAIHEFYLFKVRRSLILIFGVFVILIRYPGVQNRDDSGISKGRVLEKQVPGRLVTYMFQVLLEPIPLVVRFSARTTRKW